MIPTDEILEALELPRSEPGLGYLQALFARFNERVPFESASKIVRNADVPRLDEKARTPEIFGSDYLASGAGGTCFARVSAFEALLSGLQFVTRFALGRVQTNFDHAALRVTLDGREWIADVGFPLPALLPGETLEAEEIETPRGSLRVTPGARGRRVEILGGVPEGPRELEVFNAPVSQAADVRAQAAFDTIATVEGYRGLMEGVARVVGEEPIEEGWRLRLFPPAGAGSDPAQASSAAIDEEITPDRAALTLRVRRGSRDSFYQAIERGGRTFLLRRLVLDGARPDLLRNDSLRGRFAGTLAVDLLAWARRINK